MMKNFDVIIIGGGHAGTEAAAAAARIGASTLLVTHNKNTVGEMSCNPAIGGVAKGTLVREIDALDGVMGRAIDRAGIHYKMLNRSKGPAVWGPRAQADRVLYRNAVQEILAEYENLTIHEGAVGDIIVDNNAVKGVVLEDGKQFTAPSVVLTTGTFLNGKIHLGAKQWPAGRLGEKPSVALANRLYDLNLSMSRLKTGTPARIRKTSIDWSRCEIQPGDDAPTPFSYLTRSVEVPQIECYITRTTPRTKEIIQNNIHLSAMYSGQIESVGPRYCPSIEDKITRFADKETHQIFLEPEGLTSDLVYPNGISTSLPEEVQHEFIHSIIGLESAEIVQPGYAIEYDCVNPRELEPTLELSKLKGLYLAGQINGTTGYEEAGAQGLVAGANAVLSLSGSQFLLDRKNGYIGVMLDDLRSRGVTEPYRMFTSRSEYRLLLRADNADLRLTQMGMDAGLIGANRSKVFHVKHDAYIRGNQILANVFVTPIDMENVGINVSQDGRRRNGYEVLAFPSITVDQIDKLIPAFRNIEKDIKDALIRDALYKPFVERQKIEIAQRQQILSASIPAGMQYLGIPSLSNELQQRLSRQKPKTFGEAERLEGMTPSAMTALSVAVAKFKKTS